MNQFDSNKDYYGVLGIDKDASQRDIDRQYKREAAKHHPDRGGSEEKMKALNEAYGVLKDATLRRAYDDSRTTTTPRFTDFVPTSTPAAHDVGLMGHFLSALLCLATGLFLLFLVWTQWVVFLWPLAVVAVLIVAFGVLLARSAMIAVNDSLPETNRFKRHTRIQEFVFWTVIVATGYGLYLLLFYDWYGLYVLLSYD